MSYTPGPMEAAIIEHNGTDWIGVGDAGMDYPRQGKVRALCGPCGGEFEEESIKDAQLFAKAFDLLRACKAALEDSTVGYERHGLSADTIILLETAIAAAERPGEGKQ